MTFKEAYGVLNKHAQMLRNQQEPNIDDLLHVVTESVEAYKACKERIDAVETALEAALADPAIAASRESSDDAELAAPPPSRRSPAAQGSGNPPTNFENMDDDIPF